MKHRHVLNINNIKKAEYTYYYSFGPTKNIELRISKDGFSVCADMEKIYDKKEMLSLDTYLFPDAVKKALIVYLLHYSKCLKIKTLTATIDNDSETVIVDKESKPPIYSMINGGLARTIPKSIASDAVIKRVLRTTKSNYGREMSALFAYICSRSKSFETERFIYLWMAFNGIYGLLSEPIAKANGTDKYRKEHIQIQCILKYLSIGKECILENDKSKIANSTITILKDYDTNLTRELVEQSELSKRIEGVLIKTKEKTKYDLTAYGYLLAQFSYYFRCRIIHAGRPISLFAYSDEKELHSLTIINNLLEEFLDNNLWCFLDKEYFESIIIPKTKGIKIITDNDKNKKNK